MKKERSTKEATMPTESDVLRVDYGGLIALPLDGGKKRPAKTRAEELRLWISDEITSGRMPPGTRLDEIQLAERFNVSRTPVREALKQLNSTVGHINLLLLNEFITLVLSSSIHIVRNQCPKYCRAYGRITIAI